MNFTRTLGAFALSAVAVATVGALTLTMVASAVVGFTFMMSPTRAAEPCGEQIISILTTSASSEPYRFTSTMDLAGAKSSFTGEVVPLTAMHVRSDQNGTISEQTFVDGRGFVNYGATWTELPPEVAGHLMDVYNPELIEKLGALKSATCEGEVTVDGQRYLRFAYVFIAAEGTTNVLLADPATRRSVQLDVEGKAGEATYTASTRYEYDPAIIVTAPIP